MPNENENIVEEQKITIDDGKNTPETSQENEVVENPVATDEKEPTFTQSQVNETISKRLGRLYHRYGVEDGKGLDDLMGKAQAYDVLKQQKDALENEKNQLVKQLAYLENGINPDKVGDIEAYFKGKEIVFSSDNLKTELETHPEWKIVKEEKPQTTIQPIHSDREEKSPFDEEKFAANLFGFRNGFVKK